MNKNQNFQLPSINYNNTQKRNCNAILNFSNSHSNLFNNNNVNLSKTNELNEVNKQTEEIIEKII